MEIRLDKLTDQQCADIIAHFVKRKMIGNVDKIVIHTPEQMDITITRKKKGDDILDDGLAAVAGCFACIASM